MLFAFFLVQNYKDFKLYLYNMTYQLKKDAKKSRNIFKPIFFCFKFFVLGFYFKTYHFARIVKGYITTFQKQLFEFNSPSLNT